MSALVCVAPLVGVAFVAPSGHVGATWLGSRRTLAPRLFFGNLFGKEEEEEEAAAPGGATQDPSSEAPRAKFPDAVEAKRLRAERLALEADRAALEADMLRFQQEKLKAEQRSRAPPPPPTPITASPPPPPLAQRAEDDAVLQQLLAELDASLRLDSLDDEAGSARSGLREAVTAAYEQAKREQLDELPGLREKLSAAEQLQRTANESATGQLGFGLEMRRELVRTYRPELVIAELFQLSENKTGTPPEERAVRTRAVTTKFFQLLRRAIGIDPSALVDASVQQQTAEAVALPGEGVISLPAYRQRVRLLERHVAAGVVEYRVFAEALARQEGLALSVGAITDADSDAVQRALGLMFGNFLFKSDRSSYDEVLEELTQDIALVSGEEQEEREQTREAWEAATGEPTTPSEQWLKIFSDLLVRSSFARAFASFGGDEIDEFADPEEEVSEAFDYASSIAVPSLLVVLGVLSGSFEPVPIYVIARMLARLNLRRLAEYEGIGRVSDIDVRVSEEEGALVRPQVENLVGELGRSVAIFSLITLPLFIWIVWTVGNWMGGLLFPPPADPFAGM